MQRNLHEEQKKEKGEKVQVYPPDECKKQHIKGVCLSLWVFLHLKLTNRKHRKCKLEDDLKTLLGVLVKQNIKTEEKKIKNEKHNIR